MQENNRLQLQLAILMVIVSPVNVKTLKPGLNEIQLLSDTEHHGIEVCWPGPALIIRYK